MLRIPNQSLSHRNVGYGHGLTQRLKGRMRTVKPGSVRVHAVWSNWQKRKQEEDRGKDTQQDRRSLVIVDGASALKDEENESKDEVGKC